MSEKSESESGTQPVRVIEAIPTAGEHEVGPREIESESIPIPAHLRVYRELGHGGNRPGRAGRKQAS